MNKKSILVAATLVLLAGVIHSCKKDEDTKDESLNSETSQFSDDSNDFKSESDQADNDIIQSLQDIPAFGRVAGLQSIPVCGMSIDSSQISQKILYLNFDSTASCPGYLRKRSGQIKVQLTAGNYWRDAGAVLTLTYINFKSVRISTGRYFIVNGVKTLTNVNGNNWLGFITGTDTLTYVSRGFTIQVQFTSGLTAVWNVAHTASWWYTPATQVVYFSTNGDTSMSGFNHVGSWGTNRFGKSFTTYFDAPIHSNSSCGYWRPVSGELWHHLNNSDFDIELGTDQNGNAVSSGCAYGYKVTWTGSGGNSLQGVFSY